MYDCLAKTVTLHVCIVFISFLSKQDPSMTMTKQSPEMMLSGTLMNSNHWVVLCKWTPWRSEPSRVNWLSCSSSLLQSLPYSQTETQTTPWGVDFLDLNNIKGMMHSFLNTISGWHGWLASKALASHQGDPGLIPGQGRLWVELCVGSRLCHKGFPDHLVFHP